MDGDHALALHEIGQAKLHHGQLTLSSSMASSWLRRPATTVSLWMSATFRSSAAVDDLVGGLGGVAGGQDLGGQIGDGAFLDIVDGELGLARLVDEGRQGVHVEHDGIAAPPEGAQLVGVTEMVTVTLGHDGMHLDLPTVDE